MVSSEALLSTQEGMHPDAGAQIVSYLELTTFGAAGAGICCVLHT